jgi:gluconolactonase
MKSTESAFSARRTVGGRAADEVKVFADGLLDPEGPTLLRDGSWMVTQMHPERGCITWLSADGGERRDLGVSGQPNGIAIDGEGVAWIAESANPPSLKRMWPGGECELVLSGFFGAPFLFPNDLCFGPDGGLYMTDSGVYRAELARVPEVERFGYPVDGRVFRIDTEMLTIDRVASAIQFANGLAFGPDRALYVAESFTGRVLRYGLGDDGDALRTTEVFAELRNEEKIRQGMIGRPDGMAFAENGDLYVAMSGEGDVAVVGSDGLVKHRIELEDESPTNVAFGPKGSGDLYMTCGTLGRVEVHHVGVDGLELWA